MPEDPYSILLGESAEGTLPDEQVATTSHQPQLRMLSFHSLDLLGREDASLLLAAKIRVAPNRGRATQRLRGREARRSKFDPQTATGAEQATPGGIIGEALLKFFGYSPRNGFAEQLAENLRACLDGWILLDQVEGGTQVFEIAKEHSLRRQIARPTIGQDVTDKEYGVVNLGLKAAAAGNLLIDLGFDSMSALRAAQANDRF